jgi:hypothetical protein
MEKPTLKYFREQMEKAIYLANFYASTPKATANGKEKYLKASIQREKEKAEFYLRKMLDHGAEGNLIKISGEVWVEERGKARTKFRVKKKFQLLLISPTLEDAKEIFEAQVLNTMEFVRETVTYRTIPLKHITLI